MSDKKDRDDTVEIPVLGNTVSEEKQEKLDDGEQAPGDLNSLSTPERAWLEWFYSLSEEDQKIVERCGEYGISATPSNFDEMKEIVKKHDAETRA
jgi:hypothetical protein